MFSSSFVISFPAQLKVLIPAVSHACNLLNLLGQKSYDKYPFSQWNISKKKKSIAPILRKFSELNWYETKNTIHLILSRGKKMLADEWFSG